MSKDNTGDTDSLRELDQLFEDWEFDVTGEPPHWEKTPERQAIDKKYRDKLDRIITQEKTAAVLSMHDSIMRHELPLGTESDLAFNYARIHRWIDAQAAIPDRIKGVMVSGVPTLQNEMDKVSVQDLRLLIAALHNQSKGEL